MPIATLQGNIFNVSNWVSNKRSKISKLNPQEISTVLHGKFLIAPSNATSATAFAGNALKKHGTNPLPSSVQLARHNRIRNKYASPPIASPPGLLIYSPCSSPPILELPFPLFQAVRHDALLHNITWVAGNPK